MRRILIMILLSVPGCYDLTFGEEDHVADELRVMAIHLTPPEIRYGEPIEAEVLFTDPEDGARPLWFAWRVLYPRTDGSGETEIETFVGTADDGGQHISVTPLEKSVVLAGPPFATFEVFLCAGELNAPARLTSVSTARLFRDFCEGAPLVTALKRTSIADPTYPQTNPSIDRVSMNGESLESGHAALECDLNDCFTRLEVSLTEGSRERYVNRDFNGEAISEELEELLQVEWFVSSGRISPAVVQAIDWRGPYVTSWTPTAPGRHTLWAIVRDSRGGNGWREFRVDVKGI